METRPLTSSRRSQCGHTLVEVLIAASVSLLVTSGALWLIVQGTRTSATSANAIANDLTQWGVASRLWIDSRIANGITIYADSDADNVKRWRRAVVTDRGDFVVFSLSDTDGSGRTFYSRLSGYEYDADKRLVYRFDYVVPTADQTGNTPLEDILNDNRVDIRKTYIVVASSVDAIDSNGVFICRTSGTAASFACKVTSGLASQKTLKEKTIEATFYVRS